MKDKNSEMPAVSWLASQPARRMGSQPEEEEQEKSYRIYANNLIPNCLSLLSEDIVSASACANCFKANDAKVGERESIFSI